jgi:hypothetical protein
LVRHHGVSGLTHLVLFHATLGIRGDETGVFFRFLPRIVRDMFRGVDVETKVDLEGFKSAVAHRRLSSPFGHSGGCIRWLNRCHVAYIPASHVGLDVAGYHGFVILGKRVAFGASAQLQGGHHTFMLRDVVRHLLGLRSATFVR